MASVTAREGTRLVRADPGSQAVGTREGKRRSRTSLSVPALAPGGHRLVPGSQRMPVRLSVPGR